MSNNHLLEAAVTSRLSEHVEPESTKISDDRNEPDILTSSAHNTTTQTTIARDLLPCSSAFDVATVDAEIVDIELRNGLPHSSYTICNIVMEQPIASPNDDKIFVYNSDAVMDEETADPQRIKQERINSISCSNENSACVKVVTDCKKSKNVDTSNLHLPGSAIRQDSKFHKPWQPLRTPEAITCKPEGNTTKTDSDLDQDKFKQQTTAERRFKCEHKGCEKSFEHQTHLGFHTQHAHVGCPPYICDVEGCGRCFYTEHHLVVHLRGHTGAKPFVCPYDQCRKEFATTGNLRNHIRTHTGEKPYKCSYKGCNRGFAELSSLKKHELTHTGEKPYPCRICGRCFSQTGSRNTHERLKHKDMFTSCANTKA